MIHSGSEDVVVSVCLVWCDDVIERSHGDCMLNILNLPCRKTDLKTKIGCTS